MGTTKIIYNCADCIHYKVCKKQKEYDSIIDNVMLSEVLNDADGFGIKIICYDFLPNTGISKDDTSTLSANQMDHNW